MHNARKILVTLATVVVAGSMYGTANASTTPTIAELQKVAGEVSQGIAPTVRQEVLDFILDSTRTEALKKNCAYDRHGKTLAANGEWEDAHWYGKANPKATGLDSPEAIAEQPTYRRKLSTKTGYCYLTTHKTDTTPWPSAARKGAESRVKAAIRKLG
jgi:hypothetical protein